MLNMLKKLDIPLARIKTAAVTGKTFVWDNFTVKAFKMAWHIISASLEEETLPKKHSFRCEYCGRHFDGDDNSRIWALCQAVYVCDDCAKKEVVCEECQKHFSMIEKNWNRGSFYARLALTGNQKKYSEQDFSTTFEQKKSV